MANSCVRGARVEATCNVRYISVWTWDMHGDTWGVGSEGGGSRGEWDRGIEGGGGGLYVIIVINRP